MVERYIALAYDKGIMRTAQDLPQPIVMAAIAGERR